MRLRFRLIHFASRNPCSLMVIVSHLKMKPNLRFNAVEGTFSTNSLVLKERDARLDVQVNRHNKHSKIWLQQAKSHMVKVQVCNESCCQLSISLTNKTKFIIFLAVLIWSRPYVGYRRSPDTLRGNGALVNFIQEEIFVISSLLYRLSKPF